MSDAVQMVEIDDDTAGQRIDNVLLRLLKGVPKSRIYRIVRKGEVRLNGGRVKADTRVQAGDQLRAGNMLPRMGAIPRHVEREDFVVPINSGTL